MKIQVVKFKQTANDKQQQQRQPLKKHNSKLKSIHYDVSESGFQITVEKAIWKTTPNNHKGANGAMNQSEFITIDPIG